MYEWSAYQTNVLSEIFFFWVRAACELKINELRHQTHITVSFWYTIRCALECISQKLQVAYGRSTCIYISNNCTTMIGQLWLEMRITVLKWNAHHSLFPINHLCILTCIAWKLQVVHVYEYSAHWTTALLSKTFLVWLRVAWEIQLESYGPRHASVLLWYTIVEHCVHILQTISYIAFWYATTHDNTTHIAYDCTTQQMAVLLPTMHHFIRTRLASYTAGCSVLLIVYATIKITKRY